MDFINQLISQTRQLFQTMTPAARVTSVLLLGVIVVSLGYLFKQHSAGPDDYLFEGEFLAPRDADRVEAAIASAGLNDYQREGGRIRVPRAQKAKYLAAVAKEGALPPNFHSILENALDTSPFTDRETRRQRVKAAKEKRLSMIVSEMDGVEDAKVIYDIREGRGLARHDEVTATVSVRPVGADGLDPRRVQMIRKAVAGGIAGLAPEAVSVVNAGDGTIFGDGDGNYDFEDPYFQAKAAYEQRLAGTIEELLHYIPGTVVSVTAELDEALERTTEKLAPESEAVALRTSKEEQERTESRPAMAGRPGLDAQGPNRSEPDTMGNVVQNKDVKSTEESDNFVGRSKSLTREAGLIPRTVRTSIAIPSDYIVKVWRERNKDANEEDLTNDVMERMKQEHRLMVQDAVAPLLPKELAVSNIPNVQVSFFQSLTPEPVEEASAVTGALNWLGKYSNTLLMLAVVAAALGMLRSVVKGAPEGDQLPSVAGENIPAVEGKPVASAETEKADKTPPKDRPKLQLKKGPNLREDLSDIVREDPEAAAAILRSWIGNAA